MATVKQAGVSVGAGEIARRLGRAPPPRPFDVVGLGQNAFDHFLVVPRVPAPGGKVRYEREARQPGGQVATAVAACARLGLRARYVGKVGDDEGGRLQRADLRARGVDVGHVRVVPGARSQTGVILVDRESGERTVLWDLDERAVMRADELDRAVVCAGRVLHLDVTDVPAALRAAGWAREEGLWVSLDADRDAPGLDELLARCDLVFVAEALVAARGSLAALAARTPGICGVTRGARGAGYLVDGREHVVPAFPVAAVDTTGCGDVFHAALIVAALDGRALADAVRFACAAAALSARALGARGALPDRAEVEALLAAPDAAPVAVRDPGR